MTVFRATLCLFSALSWLWVKYKRLRREKKKLFEVAWQFDVYFLLFTISGVDLWLDFLAYCMYVSRQCLSRLPVVLYESPSQA